MVIDRPETPSHGFLARGGGWALAQSATMLAVMVLGPATRRPGSPAWMSILAGVLFALGACFGIGGAWVLGRNRTIFPRPVEGAQLVCRGVYRLVRHPLYTSVGLLSLGWAAWWASWITLATALAQSILLDYKARREEGWLRERFPGYAEYARKVRRFVPWVY